MTDITSTRMELVHAAREAVERFAARSDAHAAACAEAKSRLRFGTSQVYYPGSAAFYDATLVLAQRLYREVS